MAYSVSRLAWWFLGPRWLPEPAGPLDFLEIVVVTFPCSAVALAVFGSSVVCAARCLYWEPLSRTVAGYSTLFFGLLSTLVAVAPYARGGIMLR